MGFYLRGERWKALSAIFFVQAGGVQIANHSFGAGSEKNLHGSPYLLPASL
jgi:hypothetical protein